MLGYCLQKKVYVLLMGDLLESATKTSVKAGWAEQEFVLQKQYEDMARFLTPLAQEKLIVGFLRGNHEYRIWETSGLDITHLMCNELEVPYLGDACWNLFRVGKQRYSVYALHGRTAAQRDGTALTAIENIASSFHADVIACGHAHKCTHGIKIVQFVDPWYRIIREMRKIVVITGSYLSYGGYWQQKGGNISKVGSPKIKFFSKVHQVHISW